MSAAEGYVGKPSEKQFRERIQQDAKRTLAAQASTLRQAAQGEVVAAKLTGNPEWDILLSLLQAEIEHCDEQERDFTKKMMDPDLDPGMMWGIKISAISWHVRGNALRSVQEMPKALREDAKEAKKILAECDLA